MKEQVYDLVEAGFDVQYGPLIICQLRRWNKVEYQVYSDGYKTQCNTIYDEKYLSDAVDDFLAMKKKVRK